MPIQLPAAWDLCLHGLAIVSCRRVGDVATADWLGGRDAVVWHTRPDRQSHVAADGYDGTPTDASTDDDPAVEQDKRQVAPVP